MIGHFDYPVPFNSMLRELDLIPYRTNDILTSKIDYLFSHPTFKYKSLYNVSKCSNLLNSMSSVGVGTIRYYIMYPQQFGNRIDNIHLQILVKMWKQVIRYCKIQSIQLTKYMPTSTKLLSIENGLIEELIRTVKDYDYIQSGDDMIKIREGVGLRDRLPMKEYNLKYYDNICSEECVGGLVAESEYVG